MHREKKGQIRVNPGLITRLALVAAWQERPRYECAEEALEEWIARREREMCCDGITPRAATPRK